jgi:rhodanese-related sulfurtransferase
MTAEGYLMKKNQTHLFAQLKAFEDQISSLEEKCLRLEQKMELMIQVERNHLLRIKNKEELSDDFIFSGKKYQDLSPEKAWAMYNNPDLSFLLLDVSSKEFKHPITLPEALSIPWEELADRFMEISSRTTPIIVICEDGTTSVLACEFLVKRGFYNCNNVSGGYKFWKGILGNLKTA